MKRGPKVDNSLTFRQNLFQQLAERRYAPLAVSKVVNDPALRLLWADREHAVKRTVRRLNMQAVVED